MNASLPRILLIEPQFVLRRTIAMVARDLGVVDFQEASNVARARALLAAEAYAGLVLDLAEGPQALELLCDLRQGQFATPPDARVIGLSSAGKPVDAARLQALGVVQVLNKPVRISDLLNALAEEHSQEAPAPGALVQQPSEA